MTLGLLDLSIVTDLLLQQLEDAKTASSIWDDAANPALPKLHIHFTGLPPDATHKLADCQVSLYLFHVAPDKFYRNTFPTGGRPRITVQQPFALTLYYLLSAHSKNYVEEQQAMSVALKCFHEHSIAQASVPGNAVQEFTVTIEPESIDEISRLWQAFTSPLRLSAVYRASVVFLEPEPHEDPEPQLVTHPVVTAYPIADPVPGVITSVTATAAGRVTIAGAGFVAGAISMQIGSHIFTPTTTNPPEAGAFRYVNATELDMQLPAAAGAGHYLLRVRFDDRQPEARVRVDVP